MTKGTPLSHTAHLRWMDHIIGAAHRLEQRSAPKGIVATCTALTRSARARFRSEVQKFNERGSELEMCIIWCYIDREDSRKRAKKRMDHFYNPVMTDRIFARTEVPCVEGVEKEDKTYLIDASPSRGCYS